MTVNQPLVSALELKKAKRLLFMTHLALGDFVYHGPFLHALKAAYPNLELDLWIDDCRQRVKGWRNERNHALSQWIQHENLASVVFPIARDEQDRTKLIQKATERNYDIVVYMVGLRPGQFARVARKIANNSILVGTKPNGVWQQLKAYRHLRHVKRSFTLAQDNQENCPKKHIFERYKWRYEHCFGEMTVAEQHQYGLAVNIPETSEKSVAAWLQGYNLQAESKIVLINPVSSAKKRNMSEDALFYLLEQITQLHPAIHIVISVPPSAVDAFNAKIETSPEIPTNRVVTFTALDDFFTLPALLKQVDFIVTVETATMHLASSLGLPQFVIVREATGSWRPLRYTELYWCAGSIHSLTGEELAPSILGAIEANLTL